MTLAWNEKMIGRKVRVKADGGLSKVCTVIGLLSDIKGGVMLSERVFGFRLWNVKDLRRAP